MAAKVNENFARARAAFNAEKGRERVQSGTDLCTYPDVPGEPSCGALRRWEKAWRGNCVHITGVCSTQTASHNVERYGFGAGDGRRP